MRLIWLVFVLVWHKELPIVEVKIEEYLYVTAVLSLRLIFKKEILANIQFEVFNQKDGT